MSETISTIEVYNVLKGKLGEDGAQTLIDYVDSRVREDVVTKADLEQAKGELREEMRNLDVKIERVRSDMIKWMFIFWAGQTGVILGVLKVAKVL